MSQIISTVVPYSVLLSHILLAVVFLAVLGRDSWGKDIFELVGRNVLVLGLLISLAAIVGSLLYSEVIGYEACVLCWWQRVFLYPIAPILALGFWKKSEHVFGLAAILALAALVVGGYQELSNLTGASLLSCTEAEGACSKIFVKEFGYITIPIMSMTVSLYVLLLVWARKLWKGNNG